MNTQDLLALADREVEILGAMTPKGASPATAAIIRGLASRVRSQAERIIALGGDPEKLMPERVAA